MNNSKKTLTALLPMKAHSARVTSKNFRQIAGKPLFRWVLDTMANTKEIDRIIINTDARNILAEHKLFDGDYNGKVLIRDRRPELCGDFVSMNLVLEDDIDCVESDYYFMTHTTNPLLSNKTIIDMLDVFIKEKNMSAIDSLFSVNRHQTRFYTDKGEPINHDPNALMRTQDLAPYLEENSVGYFFTKDSFKKTNSRIGQSPYLYETPPLESIDIDEMHDWYIAESLLMRLSSDE